MPDPCKIALVLQDVAWLMKQYVTENGAVHYELARKWLWDKCEHERNFSKMRVLMVMEYMVAVLDAMPKSDTRVVYVQGFLNGLMGKVTEYALMYDLAGDNQDYDYHVLNPQMRGYVSISRT